MSTHTGWPRLVRGRFAVVDGSGHLSLPLTNITNSVGFSALRRRDRPHFRGTSNNDGFSAGRPPLRDDGHFSLLICPE
jgi:hypothetical protein